MALVRDILYGTMIFVLGTFAALIMQHIMPTLIDLLNNTTLEGIVWFGVILLWFLMLVGLPLGFKIHGLTSADGCENHMLSILFGVLYALFTLAIAYFTWYWHATITAQFNFTILTVLYYMGLFCMFLMDGIISPAYIIIRAKSS